jgi:uncharacterized membrane protein YbaN (DUF454 family)
MSENNNRIKEELSIVQNPILRQILIIGGLLFVAIGIIGMFLPLLPTTIFFILAAWCFARSSEKFHNWLHNNRLFGKYLRNYRIQKGMTIKSKAASIALLLIGISISAFYLTENLYVRILLAVIAIGVSWHIIAIKTIKEEEYM